MPDEIRLKVQSPLDSIQKAEDASFPNESQREVLSFIKDPLSPDLLRMSMKQNSINSVIDMTPKMVAKRVPSPMEKGEREINVDIVEVVKPFKQTSMQHDRRLLKKQ